MNGHVVLCGLGKVGFSALELLRALNEEVVVVARDIDRDWADRAISLASRHIRGDARSPETLTAAEVQTARSVIIATDDDLKSIAIALEVQRLAPDVPVVVRIYDELLAERVRQDLPVRAVMNAAALAAPAFLAATLGQDVLRAFAVENAFVLIARHRVIDTGTGEGQRVSEIASRYGFHPLSVQTKGGAGNATTVSPSHTLHTGDEVLAATAFPSIEAAGIASGHQRGTKHRRRRHAWVRPKVRLFHVLRYMRIHATPAMRVALVASCTLMLISIIVFHATMNLSWLDSLYFTLTIVTTVGFGDIHLLNTPTFVKLFGCLLMMSGPALFIIYFSMFTDFVVTQRFEQVVGRPHTSFTGHTVIVGLGNVGHRVALRLQAMGQAILAIEQSPNAQYAAMLPEAIPVLIGDAGQLAVLQQAGIARAKTVLAVTDNDVVNLRVAHQAEKLNPKVRTIVRVFDTTLANKLGPSLLGIDKALNPSQIAAATFVASALAPDVLQGVDLGDRLLMLRWMSPAAITSCVGSTVAEIRQNQGILVLLRRRAEGEPLQCLRLDDRITAGDHLVVVDEYRPAARQPVPVELAVVSTPQPAA